MAAAVAAALARMALSASLACSSLTCRATSSTASRSPCTARSSACADWLRPASPASHCCVSTASRSAAPRTACSPPSSPSTRWAMHMTWEAIWPCSRVCSDAWNSSTASSLRHTRSATSPTLPDIASRACWSGGMTARMPASTFWVTNAAVCWGMAATDPLSELRRWMTSVSAWTSSAGTAGGPAPDAEVEAEVADEEKRRRDEGRDRAGCAGAPFISTSAWSEPSSYPLAPPPPVAAAAPPMPGLPCLPV